MERVYNRFGEAHPRPENFLIETGGFTIRNQGSIHSVALGIISGLVQKIMLLEVFKIKLDDPVLERRERGPSPVAEGATQKHEIADYAVGDHINFPVKSILEPSK
jgi:hypothetical protein